MANHVYYMLYAVIGVTLATTNEPGETLMELFTIIYETTSSQDTATSEVIGTQPQPTTLSVSALPIVDAIERVLLITVPIIIFIIIVILVVLCALYRSHKRKARFTISHTPLNEIDIVRGNDNRAYNDVLDDDTERNPGADYQETSSNPLTDGTVGKSREPTMGSESPEHSQPRDAVVVYNVAYESIEIGDVEGRPFDLKERSSTRDANPIRGPAFNSFGKGRSVSSAQEPVEKKETTSASKLFPPTNGHARDHNAHERPLSVPPPPPYPTEEANGGEHDGVFARFEQAKTISPPAALSTNAEISEDNGIVTSIVVDGYGTYATVQKRKSEKCKKEQGRNSLSQSDHESRTSSGTEEGLPNGGGTRTNAVHESYNSRKTDGKEENGVSSDDGLPERDYEPFEEETTRL